MVAILISLPTIFLGFAKVIARFRTIFVDIFGIMYLIGCVLAFVITNIIDWIELGAQQRVQVEFVYFLFLVI